MKIEIKGVIVSDDDKWIYDWFGIGAVTPKIVSDQLKNAANGEEIEVEINSGGGSVFDASEIYTNLKDYPGNVTVKIVGLAASAASVIAMAGNKILMSPTSQMMIHNASTGSQGDYRAMDKTSEFLKNVNKTIANAYSLKSGKSYDELLTMMDNETWMTPQQALEMGLIDQIMFSEETTGAVASTSSGMLPKEVIDKIRNELLSVKTPQAIASAALDPTVSQHIENKKEGKPHMDIETLKNEYPDLYNQVREEGVKAENARIKAIEELELPGNEALINRAKFETFATCEQLAVDIIKAEKAHGANYLQNREEDAKTVNTAETVPANDQVFNQSDEKNAAALGEKIAAVINKRRGNK